MKRLLFLFFLFPLTLFGQSRRQGTIDSIKASATGNLKSIITILGDQPGIRMQQTDVIDSGEYLTIVTRIHIPKVNIFTPVTTLPVALITAEPLPARNMDMLSIPPLPDVIPDGDPVLLLAATGFVVAIPVRIMNMFIVPSLPVVVPDGDQVPLLAASGFATPLIPARRIDTVYVPPLPDAPTEYLPLLDIIEFAVADIHDAHSGTMDIPSFEVKKMPVDEMHLSTEGYSLLEKLEGFSPSLYSLKDGGFTIGFGFFLPYAEGNKWDKGVTWEEAEVMIRQKMPAYENQVKQYINVPLTQYEFDALTMLAYNLGGFAKATSIVNDINTQVDFDKLQADWNRFIHSKAPNVTRGLMNRRRDEMRVRGESYYQPERKINILTARK